MEFFAIFEILFSVVLVCHASSPNESIVSIDVDADINPQPAVELVDSLSRAIFNTFQASAVAVKKHLHELGNEVVDDVIDPVAGVVTKPISYIGKEVNEVAQDFRGVIDYIDGVIDGSIQTVENIPPEALHRIDEIWTQIQFTANKLSRDIQQYRKYIINKIRTLKDKYGEESVEFHEAMKILCLEVENRCFFAFKRAESAFRNALKLPQLNYFDINLRAWFENWELYLNLNPEAPIDEIVREARNLWNTVFNAVQVHIYLDIFSNINPKLWPCNALAWQDLTNVKQLFDRSIRKLEFYVNTSLEYINHLREKDPHAAQEELHRLNDESRSILDHLIDFTRIPFTKAYEVSTRQHCFEATPHHVRYDSAFQKLLAYLNQYGCKIHLYPREFAPITDRLSMRRAAQNTMHRTYSINMNGDAMRPGRTIYDYLRALHGPDYDFGIEDQTTQEVNIDVHAFLLHEHLITEISDCGKKVLRELKACLSKQDFYGKLVYLQFLEEMKIFLDSISYLKLYILQAVLYIETNFEPWSHEYVDALNNLETDVKHRLNVLASRLRYAFEHTIRYKNFVCEQGSTRPIPTNGYMQETPAAGYETPKSSPPSAVIPQNSQPDDQTYIRSSTDNFEDITTTKVTYELSDQNINDSTIPQTSYLPTDNEPYDADILPQTVNPELTSPPPPYETPKINPYYNGDKVQYISAPSDYVDDTLPPTQTENTDAYLLPQTANPHNPQDEHPAEGTQYDNTGQSLPPPLAFDTYVLPPASTVEDNTDAYLLPQTANPEWINPPPPAFDTYDLPPASTGEDNTDAYLLPQTANPEWIKPPPPYDETHGADSNSPPPPFVPQSPPRIKNESPSKDAHLLPEYITPPVTITDQPPSVTTYIPPTESFHDNGWHNEGSYVLPETANYHPPLETHDVPPADEYTQPEENIIPITSPRSIENTVPQNLGPTPQSPSSITTYPNNERIISLPDIRMKYDKALPTKHNTIYSEVLRRNYYTEVDNNQVITDYVSESTGNDAREVPVVLPTSGTNDYYQSSSPKNEDINELLPPEETSPFSYLTPPTQFSTYSQPNESLPWTGSKPPPPADIYKNEDINELPIIEAEENPPSPQSSDYPPMQYTSPPLASLNTRSIPPSPPMIQSPPTPRVKSEPTQTTWSPPPPWTGMKSPPPADTSSHKNEDINELPIIEPEKNPPSRSTDYPTTQFTSPPSAFSNTGNTPPYMIQSPPTSPVNPQPAQNTGVPPSPIQNPPPPAPAPKERRETNSSPVTETQPPAPAPRPRSVGAITNPPVPTTEQALPTKSSIIYSTSDNRQTDTTIFTSDNPQLHDQQPSSPPPTPHPLSGPENNSQALDNTSWSSITNEETVNQFTTTRIISASDGQPETETPTNEPDDDQDVEVISHHHSRTGHTDNQHYQSDVDNDGDVDVDVRASQTEMTDHDSTVLRVADDSPEDGVDDTTIVKETTTKHSFFSTVTSYFDNENDTQQNANT